MRPRIVKLQNIMFWFWAIFIHQDHVRSFWSITFLSTEVETSAMSTILYAALWLGASLRREFLWLFSSFQLSIWWTWFSLGIVWIGQPNTVSGIIYIITHDKDLGQQVFFSHPSVSSPWQGWAQRSKFLFFIRQVKHQSMNKHMQQGVLQAPCQHMHVWSVFLTFSFDRWINSRNKGHGVSWVIHFAQAKAASFIRLSRLSLVVRPCIHSNGKPPGWPRTQQPSQDS